MEGGRTFAVVEGKFPKGTTRGEILMELRLAENPNMPRFKSFSETSQYFKLSYFTD